MTLTEKDKEIIQKTWALVRVDSIQAGIELFRRYVSFFCTIIT